MKQLFVLLLSSVIISTSICAQENQQKNEQQAHYNISKFKQLHQELPTPNKQHTASGAPGYEYTQQQVDYKMDIVLDTENHIINGKQTITYHNNSKDNLEYLWVQLDQNMRAADSKRNDRNGGGPRVSYSPSNFTKSFMGKPFDGGFKIKTLKDSNGNDLNYTINNTMMRIDLPNPLASGKTFVFDIKWWYNINNYREDRGRSGFEIFEDGTAAYAIAQFYPRLAVYNNVEGWQNMQFWGSSEFALEFGNFDVSITTPKNYILNGTGVIKNPKDVLSKIQYNRYQQAQTNYNNPMFIVTS